MNKKQRLTAMLMLVQMFFSNGMYAEEIIPVIDNPEDCIENPVYDPGCEPIYYTIYEPSYNNIYDDIDYQYIIDDEDIIYYY